MQFVVYFKIFCKKKKKSYSTFKILDNHKDYRGKIQIAIRF